MGFVTAQFNQAYAAGTYAYRHSAAKAIEYGLEHLSNDIVGEVTATKSKSGGKLLSYGNTLIASGGSEVSFGPHEGVAPGSVGVGDVFRVHSQDGMSQIEAINETAALVMEVTTDPEFLGASGDNAYLGSNPRLINGKNYDVGATSIVDNGFKYKIKFEANSGDLPDMTCSTDNLRSVYRMDQAAYVTRDEPDRVWFVDTKQGSAQPAYSAVSQADMTHPSAIAAGDTIFVGEQRCDVIASDSDMNAGLAAEGSAIESYHSASVVCAKALSANSHSTADAICTHDAIEVSFEGSTQSCTSTDRPALRFINDIAAAASTNDCADTSACVEVLAYNGANRLVRWSTGEDITKLSTHELMDNNDLAVNDRVSIRTLNDHIYETRTVDYINFEGIDTALTGSSPKD